MGIFCEAPLRVLGDEQLALAAVTLDPLSFGYAGSALRADKAFVLEALGSTSRPFELKRFVRHLLRVQVDSGVTPGKCAVCKLPLAGEQQCFECPVCHGCPSVLACASVSGYCFPHDALSRAIWGGG